MRIAFKTFGCRANTNDTDALLLEARRQGIYTVDEQEPADAFIINTCTVTENADRDARRSAYKFKRRNPGSLVALVGCYGQVAAKEIEKLSEVDFVLGTANKFKVLQILKESRKGIQHQRNFVETASGFLPEYFPGSKNARANVKIQDGCNYKCSFCIIPTARGRSKSLPVDAVVRQVAEAYSQGFNEVVLTGIHLAHYGWDQGTDLMILIRSLLKEKTGPRIRVSTLDPFEIPDELISMIGSEERLCPHFHIAIQSGSDKVLKQMRRLYESREFIEVSRRIERQNPDTFVGVDVIVGFPGEGNAEFQETIDCLESSYYSKLHVFSYSERQGTIAAELSDKVSAKTIAQRSSELRKLSERRYASFLAGQVGKVKEVVFERRSRENAPSWLGHSENYVPVLLASDNELEKQVREVKLLEIRGSLAVGATSFGC